MARELISRGEKVRVFLLSKSYRDSLKGLDIEIFEGDILDYESLNKACKGIDVVYHLAAFISVLDSQKSLIREVNVDGTKNVIKAFLENKVRRLVYTSTVHALREPKKGIPINADCGFDPVNTRGEYDRTKADQIKKIEVFCFHGFIRCAECGCLITSETQKGHNYYHYTKRKIKCSQKYVREGNLAEQINKYI